MNSSEKDILEICQALKIMGLKLDEFFDQNLTHKSLCENTSFYDLSKCNDRICKFCLVKKPDRTHHCRTCKKCIRKMDHHCIFLGNCIGINNYKSFMLTLIYSCLILNYMFFTSLRMLFFYAQEFHVSMFVNFFLFFPFFYFNLYLFFPLISL